MKKGLLFLSMVCMLGFIPPDKKLTQKERDFAVKLMEDTRDQLLKDVRGLTPAQIHFTADSGRWSVEQCVEHIAVSEGVLTGFIRMGLQAPADSTKRDSIKYTDQQIIQMVTDRSKKQHAPEMLKPEGKFVSFEAALDSFVVRRNRTIEWLKTTPEDLRDHYFIHPLLGTLDDYQALLLVVAHSKRHTLQLEEVKANPAFPH